MSPSQVAQYPSLAGRNIFITGGATGIGAAAAELALWQTAGEHCSANERRADEASRDVEAWLKCRFMRDRLGEEF